MFARAAGSPHLVARVQRKNFLQIACGKEYRDDTVADLQMANDVLECAKANGLNAIIGNTLGANDFYEGE